MAEAHVTIYEVAARAGVSASTASRALAGLGVKKANLEAVEKAAAELGYVPNEAARGLRVVRNMTVGMVFNQLTSQLGIDLLDALAHSLDEMGYSLFVSTAQGDPDRYDKLVRRFLERRVEALICVHGRGEGAALERYQAAGIPAIGLISRGGGYERLPLISPSIAKASEACVRDLLALGHRRAAILTSEAPLPLAGEFAAVARGLGLEVGELPAEPDAVRAALERAGAPTVAVGRHLDAERLVASGLDIPGRLSVVGIRDRRWERPGQTAVSLLHIDPGQVAAAAAQALRAWLVDGQALSGNMRVHAGTWRDQGTIGPANRA